MYRDNETGPIIALLMEDVYSPAENLLENRVIALDRQSGEVIFDRRVFGNRLLVTNDSIFVAGTRFLTRLSSPQGVIVFQAELPKDCAESMIAVGNTVVLEGNGEVCCASMSDGTLLWHNTLDEYAKGAISLSIPPVP